MSEIFGNTNEYLKLNIDDSILDGLSVPNAVINAQSNCENSEEKEQKHYPTVHLFFSFDIVNSTKYKTLTGNWPIIIRGLLEDIRTRMFRDLSCFLWRVIGDEMIFVLPVQSEQEIATSIDAAFEVTQRISISLTNGKFYDTLEDQRLQSSEIAMLKNQNTLSIKVAAWMGVINDKFKSPYDNISFNYTASAHNQIIKEFLGKDIDAGFRLKGYTQDRRLAVSVELAYFLIKAKKSKNLHIIDYVRLKGVWNDGLYPIIWYYNADIVQTCHKEITNESISIPFACSFRYDETDDNPIIKKYFLRGKKNKKKSKDLKEVELASSMYKVESALKKIVFDRNLNSKIQYIESFFNKKVFIASTNLYVPPLELHCAVVCCKVKERKVLITQRGKGHSTNPGRWEFGCAKANSELSLIPSIVEYYRKAFGIGIELILDNNREEKQPFPIAVYEINSPPNIKKGIIFIARVVNSISSEEFRPEGSHDSIKWIEENEVDGFLKEDVVQDFHNTLKNVFENFDTYFKQEVR